MPFSFASILLSAYLYTYMSQTTARISIIEGDITRLKVDAIVNAANRTLLGGGGVDGAIHRTAGPQLLEECRRLNGCQTGEAKITGGYSLPASWIVHTVGPVWRGGTQNEDQLLAACYRTCLTLAANYTLSSIAYPSISTGAYGFPIERASMIAIQQLKNSLEIPSSITQIYIVCFSHSDFLHYQHAYDTIFD
jgi:O-acetyl-ADP-ribose deacetylase (regulator of RNase III)